MGYRAQKKYSQQHDDIMDELADIIYGMNQVGHGIGVSKHKLGQIDGNINLVMEKQIEIAKSLDAIKKKQDRLSSKLGKIESRRDASGKSLEELKNMLLIATVTIVFTIFGAILILA